MKKALVVLAMIVAFGASAMAQNALGLRFGGGQGYNAELSYQKDMGSANRLEFDLGWTNYANNWSYVDLSGIYQWKGTLVGILGWYAGVGANVGLYSWNNSSDLGLAIGGQLGLELVIPGTPIQLTLDTRPMYNVISPAYTDHLNWGVCLGARIQL